MATKKLLISNTAACIRKLLVILNSMLRSETPWRQKNS